MSLATFVENNDMLNDVIPTQHIKQEKGPRITKLVPLQRFSNPSLDEGKSEEVAEPFYRLQTSNFCRQTTKESGKKAKYEEEPTSNNSETRPGKGEIFLDSGEEQDKEEEEPEDLTSSIERLRRLYCKG